MKSAHENKPVWKPIVVVVILAIIVLLPAWWIFSLSANKGEEVNASITSYHAADPSTLTVEYRVTNTTDKAGYSDCSITMTDASSSNSGSDSGYESAKVIQPGEEYAGIAKVTISNQGASTITNGGITCYIK